MKSEKWKPISKEANKHVKKKSEQVWEFDLYVVGQTPETITTLSNLKKTCERHLKNCYKINLIDLQKKPHLAKEMQIFAIPTTIKKIPKPLMRLIGDFSNTDEIIHKMGIEKDG